MKAFLTVLAIVFLTLGPSLADPAAPAPGPVVGIGVEIKMLDHHPIIEQVIPGNPADKSGLKVGDRIIKIDGTSIDGLNLAQVALRLRGTAGSHVRVTIHRGGGQRTYIVKRNIIQLMPADSQSYRQ
jgi:carboxyl-terminal processing protease